MATLSEFNGAERHQDKLISLTDKVETGNLDVKICPSESAEFHLWDEFVRLLIRGHL